jgi:hypothetical protein
MREDLPERVDDNRRDFLMIRVHHLPELKKEEDQEYLFTFTFLQQLPSRQFTSLLLC